MTRGLYPRDTLTKDDLRTMQELRKNIYKNGLLGMGELHKMCFGCGQSLGIDEFGLTCHIHGSRPSSTALQTVSRMFAHSLLFSSFSPSHPGFGCTSGFVLHTGLQMAKKYGLLNSKLNKNTAMLTVLSCGALGMFLGASKTGKENVHNLHPIFQIGAVPPKPNELERVGYGKTVQQAQLGRTANNLVDNTVDRQKLEEIAMMRRTTLKNRIEKGHGISDSHGGNWYREPEEEKVDIDDLKQAQLMRRKSLADRITKGHGLSDSHGGQWYRENGK
jgi:hypothetical protein